MTKRNYPLRVAVVFVCVVLVVAIIMQIMEERKPIPKRQEAQVFFANLGPGWNLGNTLDAHVSYRSRRIEEHEQLWGNPPVTEELFATVRRAGFKTVRIPVTWYPHLNAEGDIDSLWLVRVREVVDMALANDLNVIINAHHENWYEPTAANMLTGRDLLAHLWSQIAATFADYDERLIFEGMNEPRLIDHSEEWTFGDSMARSATNTFNEAFIKAVREAGGANADRYLLIPTYAASPVPQSLEDFAIPEDPRVGVSIHLYLPTDFALEGDGATTWSAKNTADTHVIDRSFEALDKYFTSQDIPVVVTEYGAIDKDNDNYRIPWTEYFTDQAAAQDISCFWWDNGMAEEDLFTLIDRNTLKWLNPKLVDAVTDEDQAATK